MRPILATIMGCVLLVIVSTPVFPSHLASTREHLQTTAFHASHMLSAYKDQGLYESCAPKYGSPCLDRLAQIAAAGFTLVVNYDQLYGNVDQQLAYAQEANSLGLKVIWSMSDPAFWNGTDLKSYYSDLATTCSCLNNDEFINYVVNLVKNLPATWGYYIGDEVSRKDHAKMKAFADYIKELDPSHPRLYISGEDAASMGSNLQPFVDTADIIGGDIYPVSTSEPITIVGDIARSIQSIADQSDKQSAIVLQAFSWSQYPQAKWVCFLFPRCARFPTKDEMQLMHDFVLHNAHPQILLWYSYFDIVKSDKPSGHWNDLIEVANPNSTVLNQYWRRRYKPDLYEIQ